MDDVQGIEAAGLKENLPEFRAGDRVRIHVRVVEGEKSRTQVFKGDVVGRSGGQGLSGETGTPSPSGRLKRNP